MNCGNKEKLPAKQQLSGADQLLLKAADHLEKNTWIQHSLTHYPRDGSKVCAVGAMIAALDPKILSGTPRDLPAIVSTACGTVRRYVNRNVHNYTSVPSWNDNPARTKEEVIETLRAAATLEVPVTKK